MSIKFNCPHCKKEFNVKDHLAGKRAPCPACKKPLTIPAPTAAPVNVEDLAAAALADEPKSEVAKATATIEFNCYFCDEKIKVSAELEGKQTPCPECRRIVKVPLQQKQEAKDWRKADPRIPSGARQNMEPAPEGTWDARAVGVVSREALVEAQAIPKQKKRWTWQQRVRFGVRAAVVLIIVGSVAGVSMHYLSRNRQEQAVARALQAVDEKKLSPEGAAEISRAAGEYYLRQDNPDQARVLFQKARAALAPGEGISPTERDWLLTELALSQIELGGEKPQLERKARLKWDDAYNEVRQTWQNMKTPEGRSMAMRRLTQAFIAKGQAPRALPLVASFEEEGGELRGIIGLEMVRNGDQKLREAAQRLATQLQPPKPVPPSQRQQKNVPAPTTPTQPTPELPPPPPSLLALQVALGNSSKAEELAPLPAKSPAVLLGYVEGYGSGANPPLARRILADGKSSLRAEARLAALVALAEATLNRGKGSSEDGNPGEVGRTALDESFGLVEGELKGKEVSPWLLTRLVLVGGRNGVQEKAQALAGQITDAGLRGRSQLTLLRDRIEGSGAAVEDSAAQAVDKATPAHGLALEAIARHNAKAQGSAVLKVVDGWDEKTRPFGQIGAALGLQNMTK